MSQNIVHIKTISEAHNLLGLPKPKHPQVSVFKHKDLNVTPQDIADVRFNMDLYMVALKANISGALNYGRKSYDFQEGTIIFIAPNQIYSGTTDYDKNSEDWILLIDADFIRSSELGKTIDNYHFFTYEADEALHLSDEEKRSISDLILKIEKEYNQSIDKHTQEIILINIETLLKYCQRYYERQFYTRTNHNKTYISDFERYLKEHFAKDLSEVGIPTVKQCGEKLHLSSHYLSDLLKTETGKSAKEHINLFLVNKAKTILKNSEQSISEIAYELGFEYPNHFSKLFKAQTGLSPKKFRALN